MIKVSIIVPVYNVERYCRKCFDSLIHQTLSSMEIILVNDGSKDSSLEICREYAERDNRIIIINKKNEGLSEARNAGLKIAKGKYVLFIDADDYINLDTCEFFFQLADNCSLDVVTGSFINIFSSTKMKIVENYNSQGAIETGIEYLKNQFYNNKYCPNAVVNFCNREFLNSQDLFFLKGVYHEDEEWTPRMLLLAKNVLGTGYCFYNRVVRENSITTQKNKAKSTKSYLEISQKSIKKFSELEDEKLKMYLCNHMIDLYFSSIIFSDDSMRKTIDKNFPLQNASGFTRLIKARILKININIFCNLHWLFLKVKKSLKNFA